MLLNSPKYQISHVLGALINYLIFKNSIDQKCHPVFKVVSVLWSH